MATSCRQTVSNKKMSYNGFPKTKIHPTVICSPPMCLWPSSGISNGYLQVKRQVGPRKKRSLGSVRGYPGYRVNTKGLVDSESIFRHPEIVLLHLPPNLAVNDYRIQIECKLCQNSSECILTLHDDRAIFHKECVNLRQAVGADGIPLFWQQFWRKKCSIRF